jgi:hypothetical protein
MADRPNCFPHTWQVPFQMAVGIVFLVYHTIAPAALRAAGLEPVRVAKVFLDGVSGLPLTGGAVLHTSRGGPGLKPAILLIA